MKSERLIEAMTMLASVGIIAGCVYEIRTLKSAIKNSGYKIERAHDLKTGVPIDRLVKDDAVEKFGGGE